MNSEIEGKVTYLLPDDKREIYFDFVDKFKSKTKHVNEENFCTYRDPLITIDMSVFSKQSCSWIELFMKTIGAKIVEV